jgi:hypothetical protein
VTLSQCTPLDAETCPDPENNGEICPDTLAPVYVDVEYNQEATILAPPKIDTGGITIPLHHITLVSVDNLPEGITWETNALDNEFLVGTYYCILLSGTSGADVGDYPLKIVVDVYGNVGSTPVYLGESVDSTSLSIKVKWDPNGIEENGMSLQIGKVWPNPFSTELFIEPYPSVDGKCTIEIYNIIGNRLYQTELSHLNKDVIKINLPDLPDGTFILSMLYEGRRYIQLVSKCD